MARLIVTGSSTIRNYHLVAVLIDRLADEEGMDVGEVVTEARVQGVSEDAERWAAEAGVEVTQFRLDRSLYPAEETARMARRKAMVNHAAAAPESRVLVIAPQRDRGLSYIWEWENFSKNARLPVTVRYVGDDRPATSGTTPPGWRGPRQPIDLSGVTTAFQAMGTAAAGAAAQMTPAIQALADEVARHNGLAPETVREALAKVTAPPPRADYWDAQKAQAVADAVAKKREEKWARMTGDGAEARYQNLVRARLGMPAVDTGFMQAAFTLPSLA